MQCVLYAECALLNNDNKNRFGYSYIVFGRSKTWNVSPSSSHITNYLHEQKCEILKKFLYIFFVHPLSHDYPFRSLLLKV